MKCNTWNHHAFHIWSSFSTITYENFTYKIISYYYELISHLKIPYMNFIISYMNKFHIWKFHMKSWFHIWPDFTDENFIYEIMISYMIWFTYENSIYEIVISSMISFHIWKFHIWNRDFIYDLVSHMKISYMKWSFHIWNSYFIYEIICEISVKVSSLRGFFLGYPEWNVYNR